MFVAVFVTVPDIKTAKKITKSLLSKHLCACVNIVEGVQSFFWWKKRIDSSRELLLIIKTRKSLFNKLKEEVLRLHPYSVAEVIALPIKAINKDYAAWLKTEAKNG